MAGALKPLRIFSPRLRLLAEIDDYESLIVTRKWHIYGEVNLVIHQEKMHTDKLVNGNILLPGADFENAAVIRHRQSDLSTLTVRAPFLGSYLGQRLVLPGEPIEGPAETVMKTLVDMHAVNPENPYPDEEVEYFLLPFFPASFTWRKPFREFKNMVVASDQERGPSVTRQGKYQKLSDELESISRESGLGWGVRMEGQEIVFEVYESVDHSASSGEKPVIFSPSFDNVMEQTFTESDVDARTAIYATKGEETIEVGEAFGEARFEEHVKAGKEDVLEDVARRALREPAFTLEAEAIEGSFAYKKDWDLGDLVTIQNKRWGITRDTTITEVQEVYEANNLQTYVTFGEGEPTLIDKVKDEIKRLGVM